MAELKKFKDTTEKIYIMKVLIFICFFSILAQANTETVLEVSSNESLVVENNRLDNLEINSKEDSQSFLELGVEYPINFGLHFRYLLLEDVYARFGFGFMSEFFLESFSKVSPALGFLNKEEAEILSDTFKNSMYLDFRLGWIPYLKKTNGGPYIELGLSSSVLGKGELRGLSLNQVLPDSEFNENQTYSAKTNSYNGTLHIGYQIPLDKLKLNLELGLVKILKADMFNLSKDQRELLNLSSLNSRQKENFQNFLWDKGWIFPTVSGWISFSF